LGRQHEASDEQPNFLGFHAASSGNEARDFCVQHPEDGFEEVREGLKVEDGGFEGMLSPLKPMQRVFKAESLSLKAGHQGLQPAASGFDGKEPWLKAEEVRLVANEVGTPASVRVGLSWGTSASVCEICR